MTELRLKGKKPAPKLRFKPSKEYVFILHSIDGRDIDREFESLEDMVAYCEKIIL